MDGASRLEANPLLTIWTRPRATIQQIIDTEPERHVPALAALIGIAQALDNAGQRSTGDHLGLGTILAITLIAGPLLGVIGLYVWGAAVRWSGRWLGGRAAARDIRAASVWAGVPSLAGALLWIPLVILLGREAFTSSSPSLERDPALALIATSLHLLKLGAAVWTAVVFCKCLGQVQGFSAWRALGNALLAVLALVLAILAVGSVAVLVLR